MGNQIIQSIKTIAQSLVDNAGYDKTRGGLIVGVNTITNTYSVKVDGVTYPIVRAVDDATYNIGDVVKVVIPCNQATQMYISSSILSDNSLGNKIANATGLAESANEATEALDTDLSDFKSNEYAQINEEVGGLVNYKDKNEEVIADIREELSQELVARKFARIENGSLILGETNGTTAILTNEQFGFYTPNSEAPASYFGKDGDVWAFNIERGIVTNDLRFNGFQWISRANKNMSLKWLE